MSKLNQMTRAELRAVPRREWGDDIGPVQELVLLPRSQRHDSGYRLIDVVAVLLSGDLVLCGGCSDALHCFRGTPWNVDALPKSGAVRIWFHEPVTLGPDLSSLMVERAET